MKRALPVIFGSNLGTTATGWLVATVGFKLPIDNFALPLVGIGGLLLFFFRDFPRYYHAGRFTLSFGLIFLGLQYMKVSIESLTQTLELAQFVDYGLFVFLIIGFILTALIQSSSAVIVIALSALHTGLIALPMAAAIVVGSNVGTTLTIFLGSLGGIPAKKQVAFAHFLFNVITAGLSFLVLNWLLQLITEGWGLRDPLFALVAFHTVLNLLGVIVFLPFTPMLARVLEKMFVAKRVTINQYIHLVTAEVPEAALEALRRETRRLLLIGIFLNLKALRLTNKGLNQHLAQTETNTSTKIYRLHYREIYQQVKQLEGEMLRYQVVIQEQSLSPTETRQLNQLSQAIQNISHSVKGLKDVEHNLRDFEIRTKKYYQHLLSRFRDSTQQFYEALTELWLTEGGKSFEELSSLTVMIQQNYEQLLSDIYQTTDKKSLDEISLSTLANVNRELYSSHKAILLATTNLLGFPSHDVSALKPTLVTAEENSV
jgi:phosphate:Na+ symporter